MSRSLGTLTLDLVAKVGGFVAGMDKADRKTKQSAANMSKYGKTIGTAIGAGAVAAVAGIALVVNKQRDLIDQNSKLAQSLGTTYTGLANMQRAAELSGVSTSGLEQATKDLTRRLSQAAQGAGPAVQALERLNLVAGDLSQMPLDERIATINSRIREFIPAAERAAVAGQLFGEEGSLAIQRISPETIADAARQVEIFGLNLSDIDAAKVEMANDAMSTFGLMTDGIGKQLTIELAPALKAVGDLFLQSAEEAGGMGDVVRDSVDEAVTAISFVLDAGDGVVRVFQAVGRAGAAAFLGLVSAAYDAAAAIIEGPSGAINTLIKGLNSFGANIKLIEPPQFAKGLREEAAAAAAAARLGIEDIEDILSKPLAGTAFRKFYEEAQEGAEEAAREVIEGRKAFDAMGEAAVKSGQKVATSSKAAVDPIQQQISAIERAAAVWGMTADQVQVYDLRLKGATESQVAYAQSILDAVAAAEAQKEINDQVGGILDSLKSEEQLLRESYERRKQIIIDSTILAEEEKAAALLKLNEGLNEELLDGQTGYWEQWLEGAEESLTSFDELAGSVIENFSGRFGDAFEAMVFDSQSLGESIQGLAEGMARSVINALGQMAAQWLAYQAVQLLVGKTTQASAVTATAGNAYAGVMLAGINAFASTAAIPIVGPVAAPAAMTAAIAATSPMAAAATAYSMMGMAHDGIMSVPKTGTWLLEKGERVTTAETSAKLDGMLDRAAKGGGIGGTVINIVESKDRAGTQQQRQGADGREEVDVFVADIMGDGKRARALQAAFGLQRRGA